MAKQPGAQKMLGFPRETFHGERRIGLLPEFVEKLQRMGFDIIIETGAALESGFSDESYIAKGCRVAASAKELYSRAEVIVKIQSPSPEECALLRPTQTLISYIFPGRNPELLQRLVKTQNLSVLAMDMVPRISRAQKLDSLSSMAKIAGYRAVIEACNAFPRFCQQEITAAGTVKPARFLIIGGGVAGLAALGVAHKLGAVVEVFDTRAAVKEQVESMGGVFLEITVTEDGDGSGGYAKTMSAAYVEAEMAMFAEKCREVDVVITTAAIPGKPAPKLITTAMVETMKIGSVIVDLAAAQGGNCDLTKVDEIYRYKDRVTIIGFRDLPNRMPGQASQLYSGNIVQLLQELGGGTGWNLNMENQVIRGMTVVHNCQITFPPPDVPMPMPAARPPPVVKTPEELAREEKAEKRKTLIFRISWQGSLLALLLLIALWGQASESISTSLLPHMLVFVLAIVCGWTLIWNVAPALRTPLMSVTNAVSGIVILGGIVQLKGDSSGATIVLSVVATVVACINAVGGFFVTQRMLQMFTK